MAFSIGRAGKTLTLPKALVWRDNGGTVDVRLALRGLSPKADALRLRDQLLGYQDNNDEPIVPVVMDDEVRQTGYYEVLSAQATTDPASVSLGIVGVDMSLKRVRNFSNPMFESIINGALMPNVVGGAVGDVVQFHGFPGTTEEYHRGTPGGGLITTRASGDGNVSFSRTGLITDPAQFALRPSDFYVGAATFEQGASLQPIVGRTYQVDDVVNWRLSNGLVRLVPVDFVSSPLQFSTSHWKFGTGWCTPKKYILLQSGHVNWLGAAQSVTVLRNSPEEVAVRVACVPTNVLKYLLGRIFFDLSLRRGDNLVRCVLTSEIVTVRPQLELFTPEAGTAIAFGGVAGGGIRATANDVDGNRYVMLSYQTATTTDLVNGRLTQNVAAATFDFAVGCEVGGSGAAVPDTAASLGGQYLAAMAEKQAIVAR